MIISRYLIPVRINDSNEHYDPSNEIVFNVSKETTKREVISIEGIDETTKRMAAMNLSGGHVNSVEICNSLFKLPSFDDLLISFNKHNLTLPESI